MTSARPSSIKNRLTRMNMLVTVAALLVASAAFVAYAVNTLHDSMVHNLSIEAQMAASTSASALLFNDPAAATVTLSALRASPSIIFAGIYGPDRKLFAGFWRNGSESAVRPLPVLPGGAVEAHWFTTRELALGRRIVFQDKVIGTVYIQSDLQEEQNLLLRYLGAVLGVLLISLLAAFPLSSLLQRTLSGPLAQLAETARVVSREKRYDVRVPATGGGDEVAVLIGAFNEMLTQIQERDAALHQAHERLNLSLASSAMGTWSWDIGGDAFAWDDYMYPLFGLEPGAFGGRYADFLNLVNPADRDRVRSAVADSVDKETAYDTEFRVIWPDGAEHAVGARGKVYRDAAGRPVRMTGVCWDVTERKHLEEQLRQSQKLESVGLLAGGVAHDFNNLLTVIAGYAEMIYDDLPPSSPQREAISEVSGAAARAGALTRQLLAFSRRQTSEPKSVSINNLVRNVEKMLRRLIDEDIELVLELAEDAGMLLADPVQIEQVILNLVVNARDAMPDGGRLTIESARFVADEEFAHAHLGVSPGAYVQLSVADSGTGMTPETVAHIFEPFFTTKEKGKGTGLGLSTVYGIVKQSRGSISVYSEPGRGSRFQMLFPAAAEALESGRPAPASTPKPGSETIVLAEDEPGVRKYVREVLERRGYQVLEATNGKAAMEAALRHQGRIGMLLTDVVMPEVGGVELAAQFAAAFPEVPVLFMSGYNERLRRREPDVNFIQKPFTPAILLNEVRRVLDETKG